MKHPNSMLGSISDPSTPICCPKSDDGLYGIAFLVALGPNLCPTQVMPTPACYSRWNFDAVLEPILLQHAIQNRECAKTLKNTENEASKFHSGSHLGPIWAVFASKSNTAICNIALCLSIGRIWIKIYGVLECSAFLLGRFFRLGIDLDPFSPRQMMKNQKKRAHRSWHPTTATSRGGPQTTKNHVFAKM